MYSSFLRCDCCTDGCRIDNGRVYTFSGSPLKEDVQKYLRAEGWQDAESYRVPWFPAPLLYVMGLSTLLGTTILAYPFVSAVLGACFIIMAAIVFLNFDARDRAFLESLQASHPHDD